MNVSHKLAVASTALLLTGVAQADFSANIGWASDYYFRGIHQKASSASAGLDYENNGFFAGTWAADVGGHFGDGLELDAYFGYSGEIAEINYAVGYTGYFYTGDFGGEYVELGYNTTVAELDIGFAAIFSNEKLVGEATEALVFTIGKTFDIN